MIAALLATGAASAAGVEVVSQGQAEQYSAERLVVHSDRIGRDFMVEVTTPRAPRAPGQKMPAIYALDIGYGIAGPAGMMLSDSGGMTPAIIVAIGYLPGQTNFRNTDLVAPRFERDGVTYGGGGEAFEAFLVEDLRPFLEARYSLDPGRAYLFGHSFGGLFAAEMLADRPEAFRGYLIGSPSLAPDPTVFGRIAALAARGAGRRVFVAWGGKEAPQITESAAKLVAVLSQKPSTFVVTARPFADETHASYYPALVPAGFQWLLPRPPERHEIAAAPQLLERYVGVYRLADGRSATVTLHAGHLLGQLTGLPPIDLFAESPNSFFVKGFDVQVRFDAKAPGPATGLLLTIGGTEAQAARAD